MQPAASTPSRPLVHLFQYTRWANDRILSALQDLEASRGDDAFEQARGLLSHLLRAQAIWWGRVQQTDDAMLDLWAVDDLDTCAERSVHSTERWIDTVRTMKPAAPIRYRNSAGTPFTNEFQVIAHHVVNHSTHHRAQIARLVRTMGHPPPATDYIFFVRDPEADPRHPLHPMARPPRRTTS